MERNNLTICRQDVVIVSDAGLQSTKDPGSNKKKKLKNRVRCIRKVQLSTISVDRIVPICYRARCRRGSRYHKITSKKNNRYRDDKTLADVKVKNNINEDTDSTDAYTGELYSPITVESSSDNTHGNISACGIKIISSDSDELEELIKSTRLRMKQNVIAPTTQDDFDNISSNEQDGNGSIRSMDTIVLQNEKPTSAAVLSPEQPIDANPSKGNKRDVGTQKYCHDNEIIEQEVPSPFSEKTNGNSSPMYEISGKVFMEHYLNTSTI